MTDCQVLKCCHGYIESQINPQKSIPLDYLDSLNVDDIDAISKEMFEDYVYSKTEVKYLLKRLSTIIKKLEKDA